MEPKDAQQTLPTPVSYNSPSFPLKLVIIIISFVIVIILSFIGGYLFPKILPINNQSSTTPPNINTNIALSQPAQVANSNLPIDLSASEVKSLTFVYLLSGIVDNIKPNTKNILKNNIQGYDIQIMNPTGSLVNQVFFVSIQTSQIVSRDKNGQETSFNISTLKKGDSVEISYQVDAKNQKQTLVTKLAVIK